MERAENWLEGHCHVSVWSCLCCLLSNHQNEDTAKSWEVLSVAAPHTPPSFLVTVQLVSCPAREAAVSEKCYSRFHVSFPTAGVQQWLLGMVLLVDPSLWINPTCVCVCRCECTLTLLWLNLQEGLLGFMAAACKDIALACGPFELESAEPELCFPRGLVSVWRCTSRSEGQRLHDPHHHHHFCPIL